MSENAPTVGIDLGTTNSAVAVMTDSGPRLIPNAHGEVLTPSVVGIDPSGSVLVGRAARELQVVSPERCASVFKREMGLATQRTLAGKQFGAVELSSLVLGSLLADARKELGDGVGSAVITVPAYFNNHQRRATMLAGEMAGWDVRRIINEPTAAALAYGLHEGNSQRTVAVFDLGGGTFDISLVDYFEGAIEVRASAGESVLGGEDFTRALAREALQRAGLAFEKIELRKPQLLSRLWQQCEIVKRTLSASPEADLRLPGDDGSLGPDSQVIHIDRETLERCCQPVLRLVSTPVKRVLGDSGIAREAIDEVILVGGATRMPCVVELAQSLFGQAPSCRLNPDEVVAMGAAVQAALLDGNQHLEDMVVVDVAPFSLGIETAREFGDERHTGYFTPIIHRNTVIPASRVMRFSTISPWQREIKISIFQGESRRVSENVALGSMDVHGIPPSASPQSISVRFTYDSNGVLEVDALVDATGAKFSTVITSLATHLDEAAIREAVRRMQSIKVHPRDDAVNVHALHRAERIYREASPELRDALSHRIDAFEQALACQDPGRVEECRRYLDDMLNLLDSEGQEP